ncbi:MAG: hypothetical protein RIR36_23 [Bacteroidota bacterium]|jgi:uncharacterized protein (TIGR02145 family)
MKKKIIVLLLCAHSYAQVGIGISTPSSSAVLDLTSTSKGFLPPRMTTEERNAISSPVAGLTIYNTNLNCLETYDGVRWINYRSITSTDVLNPITNQIWMDRNLGATQVATSSTDFNGYGSLFQWGRAADGHQLINWTSSGSGVGVNSITFTLSDTDSPTTSQYIVTQQNRYPGSIVNSNDWRSGHNNNLWQGANGINNPCPWGYRLPTATEWEAERQSWTSNDANGAFASPLKLPLAGYRHSQLDIGIASGTEYGYYWSSTVNGNESKVLAFSVYDSNANISNQGRSYGSSVRCIKN